MAEQKIKMEKQSENMEENIMRKVEIEKVIVSCGGIKEELEKSVKLLEKLSGRKVSRRLTTKRIPGFAIRPQMEVGCMVTLRGEEGIELLKRLLAAIENTLSEKQINNNHFSFGVHEYIEIPGEKYDRDIGLTGLQATIVFARKGKRVAKKKIKRGKLPKRQDVLKEEIIKYMEDNFGTDVE
jgi:large subunit ribosomal protein L5